MEQVPQQGEIANEKLQNPASQSARGIFELARQKINNQDDSSRQKYRAAQNQEGCKGPFFAKFQAVRGGLPLTRKAPPAGPNLPNRRNTLPGFQCVAPCGDVLRSLLRAEFQSPVNGGQEVFRIF